MCYRKISIYKESRPDSNVRNDAVQHSTVASLDKETNLMMIFTSRFHCTSMERKCEERSACFAKKKQVADEQHICKKTKWQKQERRKKKEEEEKQSYEKMEVQSDLEIFN